MDQSGRGQALEEGSTQGHWESPPTTSMGGHTPGAHSGGWGCGRVLSSEHRHMGKGEEEHMVGSGVCGGYQAEAHHGIHHHQP